MSCTNAATVTEEITDMGKLEFSSYDSLHVSKVDTPSEIWAKLGKDLLDDYNLKANSQTDSHMHFGHKNLRVLVALAACYMQQWRHQSNKIIRAMKGLEVGVSYGNSSHLIMFCRSCSSWGLHVRV